MGFTPPQYGAIVSVNFFQPQTLVLAIRFFQMERALLLMVSVCFPKGNGYFFLWNGSTF